MAMTTVALSKPITAHGEEVSELTFRKPTTEDVMELGLPQLVVVSEDGSPGVEVRTKVVGRYVARLAAIPANSVKALTIRDFNQCISVVMGFFNEGDGEA